MFTQPPAGEVQKGKLEKKGRKLDSNPSVTPYRESTATAAFRTTTCLSCSTRMYPVPVSKSFTQ